MTQHLNLQKKKGFWYFARRVPSRYAALDPRGTVYISTHIRIVDDPRAICARKRAVEFNDELFLRWETAAGAAKPR